MKNLETRLRRLERAAKRSARKVRCPTCQDWPRYFYDFERDWRACRAHVTRDSDASDLLRDSDDLDSLDDPSSATKPPASLDDPSSPGDHAAPPADRTSTAEPPWAQPCPNCGWQPITITVTFVDDWRKVVDEYRQEQYLER